MAEERKQRGRPPLEAGIAKRASFNTRLRPSLKLALEAAAKREGRSLSEEIEFRLERSFDETRTLDQIRAALEHAMEQVQKKAAEELERLRRKHDAATPEWLRQEQDESTRRHVPGYMETARPPMQSESMGWRVSRQIGRLRRRQLRHQPKMKTKTD